MQEKNRSLLLAYLCILVAPAFFSTNVVFGRAANEVAPFLLAFIRWSATSTILLLFCRNRWGEMADFVARQWRRFLLLGFLGMFICGGIVYIALHHTTASNAMLIYTIPPVLVLLIERFWRARPMSKREMGGVFLAIAGVAIIVTRGNHEALLSLDFNLGDLLILLAAVGWAVYLVVLKSEELAPIDTLPLFAIISAFGTFTLLPLAIAEIWIGEGLPVSLSQWQIIGGIILFASLIAFSTFQYGVKMLGSSVASIFMYLMPPFGLGLSWGFLGERIFGYHWIGIAVILTGVILATFPNRILERLKRL
jgi:drug/metabolite transporter (DMT)-like permease